MALICDDTTVCQAADVSVATMDSFFQSLDASLQTEFRAMHDAIMQNYAANHSWYTNYIPFNPTCCTLQTIGQQADDLLSQMQQAIGQSPTAGASATPASLWDAIFGTGAGSDLSTKLGNLSGWMPLALIGVGLYVLAPYVTRSK